MKDIQLEKYLEAKVERYALGLGGYAGECPILRDLLEDLREMKASTNAEIISGLAVSRYCTTKKGGGPISLQCENAPLLS